MNILKTLLCLVAAFFALGSTIIFRKSLMTFIQMAHESELIVKGHITSIDGNIESPQSGMVTGL